MGSEPAFPTRSRTSEIVRWLLEPLLQGHIPGSPLDIGRRLIVAVFTSGAHERRLFIEYIIHAEGNRCLVKPCAPATGIVFRGRDRYHVLVFTVFRFHTSATI